jgi:hypothetical protein
MRPRTGYNRRERSFRRHLICCIHGIIVFHVVQDLAVCDLELDTTEEDDLLDAIAEWQES